MEKILDASGYHFHVLTIDGHKYWIGRELVNAFDHAKNKGSMNMFNNVKNGLAGILPGSNKKEPEAKEHQDITSLKNHMQSIQQRLCSGELNPHKRIE